MAPAACSLCETDGGAMVWRGARWRVVRADESGFPAFYRLIWNDHVAEFSDLSRADRQLCMDGVCVIEETMRAHLQPTKLNLATLGNVVPHLHWHVIARFAWDSHFPAPVWAASHREASDAQLLAVTARLAAVDDAIRDGMAALAV